MNCDPITALRSIADDASSAQFEPDIIHSPARMIRTCNAVILLAAMLNSFIDHLNKYPLNPAILTNKNTRLRPWPSAVAKPP